MVAIRRSLTKTVTCMTVAFILTLSSNGLADVYGGPCRDNCYLDFSYCISVAFPIAVLSGPFTPATGLGAMAICTANLAWCLYRCGDGPGAPNGIYNPDVVAWTDDWHCESSPVQFHVKVIQTDTGEDVTASVVESVFVSSLQMSSIDMT